MFEKNNKPIDGCMSLGREKVVTMNFHHFSDDHKVIFLLGLSEKVLSIFSREENRLAAQQALGLCWQWLEEKESMGETLYNLLDNEESGITTIQEMSADDTEISAWNCMIDAVAYTSRKAFEREGVAYYPEPIALVDDTLVNHFIECFEEAIVDAPYYIQQVISILNKSAKGNGIKELRTEILSELQILSK